eukprot:IDg9467t1
MNTSALPLYTPFFAGWRKCGRQRKERYLEQHYKAFLEFEEPWWDVYIVRLRQDGHVDHAVVVDANNRIIVDSEETSALRCAAYVLERCGGEFVDRLRVCK